MGAAERAIVAAEASHLNLTARREAIVAASDQASEVDRAGMLTAAADALTLAVKSDFVMQNETQGVGDFEMKRLACGG